MTDEELYALGESHDEEETVVEDIEYTDWAQDNDRKY